MKVLLIGGSGIISSEVCARCVEQGIDVTILNRGRRKAFIHSGAAEIIANVREDSETSLKQKINGQQWDVVVDFITYNVRQMKKSLDVFADCCTQYIFISSATAYIDVDKTIDETVPVGNDKWQYSYDKSKCEEYLREKASEYGVQYTIIRPYITYNKTRIPYQFAPIEYYTIVNRILCGKPLPICGENVKCTLTSSKDFAVACEGLFLNENAYGESFHITSDCEMTWKEVAETIAAELGMPVSLVQIPQETLALGSHKLGFDVDELTGDKSRNMVFCNRKIKMAVPQFTGKIAFDEGVKESLAYYNDNSDKCIVNYAWDGRIDNLLASVLKGKKYKYDKNTYTSKMSAKDKIIYTINRYNCLWQMYKFLKSIKSFVKKP